MRLRTVFLWTMIVSLSIAAAVGVAAILFPTFGRTQDRILFTTLLVGLFSLPALACAIVMDRHRLVPLMWTGIGSTLAALALWLTMIWIDLWRFDAWAEFVGKSGTLFTVMAVLAMQIGLLTLLRLDRPAFRTIRAATIGCSVMLGLMIVLCMWFEWFDEATGKTIAVLAILSACGTVVTPVFGIIESLQRRGSRESIPSQVQIDLTCPRCKLRQVLNAGAARCAGCHLRINIDVEEPRCACGYLLYQLQGDICPECGKSVTKGS